jgi:hypothetical protein
MLSANHQATAGGVYAELHRRGLGLPDGDPDRRALLGCHLIAGSGGHLGLNPLCNLLFDRAALTITATDSGATLRIPYTDIQDLEVAGPGAVTRGGGFIGRGRGVTGAPDGLLAAQVLNALTTRTTIQTLIRVAFRGGELIFSWDRKTPAQVRLDLSPVFARIASAHEQLHRSRIASTPSTLAEQLQKIAELRAAGHLTEEEFAVAKSKILYDTIS